MFNTFLNEKRGRGSEHEEKTHFYTQNAMFSKRKQTFFKNTRSDNLQLETDWPATFQLMLSLMCDSEIYIFYVNVYQNRGQARVRIWEVLGRLPGEPWKKMIYVGFI